MGEKRLLPLVSQNIEEVVKADYYDGREKYVTELIEHIKKENPRIAYLISDYVKGLREAGEEENSPAIKAAIYSGIFVYKLLESQAEADQLEKDIFNQ